MIVIFLIVMYLLIKREWNRKNRLWTDERIKREENKRKVEEEQNYKALVKGTRMGSDDALARRLKYCDRANGERGHSTFNDFFRKEVRNNE